MTRQIKETSLSLKTAVVIAATSGVGFAYVKALL